MKTERIEACIEYVRHMETCGIGQRDPNKCGATEARAELAALKEAEEAARQEEREKLLNWLRKAILDGFKWWMDGDQKELTEPWETFKVTLIGQEAGDMPTSEKVVEILEAAIRARGAKR